MCNSCGETFALLCNTNIAQTLFTKFETLAPVSRQNLFLCRISGDGMRWQHVYAVDRAGRHTQVTTRTLGDDHRVHLFCGTENGIDRAGLNTLGTADAFVIANEGDPALLLNAMCG